MVHANIPFSSLHSSVANGTYLPLEAHFSHTVKNACQNHTVAPYRFSCPVDTGGSFPGDEEARA